MSEALTRIGIIGAGAVGTSCAKAMLLRGTCPELVLVDIDERRSRGVATDLSHGEPLCPRTDIRSGSYDDLAGAALVVITAGINEQAGGATDRKDDRGRLRLLPHNAAVYADVVPRIARVTSAPILVVTDPPDPLADVARRHVQGNQVLSSGTFLDSLRFRIQIGRRLGCHPASVHAFVIGEHGTSQVYVWSSASIGGESVLGLAARRGLDPLSFKVEVERAVKYANIDIIEGTGASQHGIGMATARIAEALLRDGELVEPIGVFHPSFGVTLSLPCVIRRSGVQPADILRPGLSPDESSALAASAAAICAALKRLDHPELREVEVQPPDRPGAKRSHSP